MVICTVEVNEKSPQTIVIGRRGTYNTQEIVFDIGYLIDAYGAGTAVLAIKRSQDASAYPTVVTQEDIALTWVVSEVDTYYVGAGECQLMWYVDGGLAKTIIYPLVVMRDILSTSEEAPDAYQTWVDDLTALGAETLENAQNAAQSASDAESAKDDVVAAKEAAEEAAEKAEEASVHAPVIQGGYWYIWNNGQYVNTGVQAEGQKGDKGDPGEKGETGNGIASIAKTGTSGLVDTYTVTYTDGTITTFTVTNGAKGDKGDTGATGNGIQSITKTGTSGNVDTYTITYTNGQTTTFTVTNGAVSSVAGKTGAVTLDANDVAFSESGTYDEGTVGAEVSAQKNAISQKAPVIINSASGDIASFSDGADGMPFKKIIGTIVPQQAAGTPSPENPLPISGWTAAEVTSIGKNLFGGDAFANAIVSKFRSAVKNTTDKTIAYPSSGCGGIAIYDKFKPNTRYTVFTKLAESSSSSRNLIIYYTDNTITTINADVIVSTAGKSIKDIRGQYQSGTTVMLYEQCGLFEGVLTSTDFVPYSSQTLPINWQSEAGTIYGGTVTLNEDGSADVVKTWSGAAMSSLTWTYNSTRQVFESGYITRPISTAGVLSCLCSMYKAIENTIYTSEDLTIHFNSSSSEEKSYFRVKDLSCNGNVSAFTAKIAEANGFVVWKRQPVLYESYHFDDIGQLYTYFGTNNIWIDTGSISECDYPADTKLYVDGLTAPDEDMIANANIASGKYFVVNNQLYLSTAAIAAGTSIVPGTNCTATNLAEALNALNT